MNNKSQVVKLLFANLRNHPVRDNMELEPAPIHVAYIVENYSFRTAVFKSIDNMANFNLSTQLLYAST